MSAHAGRFINQRCVSTNWKKEERLNITTYPIMLMSLHFHAIMDMIIISRILQEIKGRTSTRYRQWILDNASERFNDFCVISKGKKTLRLLQPGVGFDRNLWNARAIHYATNYIEANPVRAEYVKTPEHWPWSSARVRMMDTGLVPDDFNVPFLMK